MSTENHRKIKCPHCEEEFEAKFWTVVRGDTDLDLKDMILRGDFNTLLCPHCSKIFFYEDNFIYLDPSAQLLVFVMPSYEKGKKELIEKLSQDYETIREYLEEKINLNFEPWYLFGVEELKKLLENDIDTEEETEVIFEICKIRKIKTANIDKNIARKNNLPFIIPIEESKHKEDTIEITKALLSDNPTLYRLKNLIKFLEETEEELKDFINENNSTK